MKAETRLGIAFGVAALALATAPARAQDIPPSPPADTPATDSIGPRELQNFSIDGTVTRRADPPAARQSAPPAAPRTTPTDSIARVAPPATDRQPDAPAPKLAERPTLGPPEPARAPPRPATKSRAVPASSVTVPLPPLDGRISGSTASAFPDPDAVEVPPRRGFSAWPWLLAAIALALGGFYLWRSRARLAFAGHADRGQVSAFVPPAPVPAPRPVTPPQARSSPGVIATRLRPRLEFAFKPLRCAVDGERVLVDFELELINSGSAPARAVLIEASMFNAGAGQDQAVGAFFANPVGEGERILEIAPLKRIAIRSQVEAPRADVQLFKVEGREMFVPLIAFNSLYRWSSGEGQSSSAYIVGRDTGGAKLAPLRSDLGERTFADLGARPLPNAVRI